MWHDIWVSYSQRGVGRSNKRVRRGHTHMRRSNKRGASLCQVLFSTSRWRRRRSPSPSLPLSHTFLFFSFISFPFSFFFFFFFFFFYFNMSEKKQINKIEMEKKIELYKKIQHGIPIHQNSNLPSSSSLVPSFCSLLFC